MISQMRDQFFTLLVGIGFASPPHNNYRGRGKNRYGGAASDKSAPYNANASNLQLVTAVIAAGLCVAPACAQVNLCHRGERGVLSRPRGDCRYPNVIIVKPGGREPKLLTRIGEVFLHPCSVNFNRSAFGSNYLVYHEKVPAPLAAATLGAVCGVCGPYRLCVAADAPGQDNQSLRARCQRGASVRAPPPRTRGGFTTPPRRAHRD